MINIEKFKYVFVIIFIFSLSCANIHKDVFRKKPEKKETYKQSEIETKASKNSITVNSTEQEAWDATLYSIGWIKWKIFNEDSQNGTIVLKEAYVFDDNNKFKRIYHWPPKENALKSNITDYLRKITFKNPNVPIKNVSFTQENMKFKLSKSATGKIKITVDYQIFPYMKNFKLGNQLKSSYYIEDIIFGKIKEYLASN
ncbi:MAG: hypothetical protein ACR2NW_08095 [Thermodesulfobacteriota bacterium]